MSTSDDKVSDVPSRKRIQEERLETGKRIALEKTNDQQTATDDDTEDEGNESYHDEEENRVFQTFMDKANLIQYTDEFGVLQGLMKYINENIQIWKTRKLKIAIIGNSGTGKSSFINAIRGLKPDDEGAAKVGVTETTMNKQEYILPKNNNISLWDLPGVGTQKFKKEDYLDAVDLKEFDAFMIVSATRFSENDVWLANEILKHDSNIFFLRTKIDQDLNNEKSDHPKEYNKDDCLRKIRMDIVNNLKKSKFSRKRTGVYLVSSRESSNFDFPKLLCRLNKIVSKKRFALRRVLENHLKGILQQKQKVKKGHFFWKKVNLFFDKNSLYSCTRYMHKNCKTAFSLDDNIILQVSEQIGLSVQVLKTKELKYFNYLEKEKYNNMHLLNSFLGSLRVFKSRLNAVCDVLAEDEEKLVRLLLNHLEEQLRPF
ncbi:interferon-gamma-inducible GTPase 10-like [Ruditapes philippinarum]|uniref:interferon-gamma-inducible GTPase 10-like n=1 Tax=Ruditapes philippinarum TaxID=129788 RepID=UPI00295AFED0|nr:interferon-gamma-inducible GTPase 10-like [Ruditapes philippinarum]